jgi:hypothetical protein
VVGAVFFEAVGMVLNAGALGFHAAGWAAGSKKGSWIDIGLDVAGFIPFGDFARIGKVAANGVTGVKIPMKLTEFGAAASDAWKRADDLVEQVGGARFGTETEKELKNWTAGLIEKKDVIHLTADKFTDRLNLAFRRHFGDAKLYEAGTRLSDQLFQRVVPNLIENTPLRNIPHLADSVKPIVDSSGGVVGKYIDPRSWAARGYEAVTGAKHLYAEGAKYVTEDVDYLSDHVKESVRETREKIERTVHGLSDFG